MERTYQWQRMIFQIAEDDIPMALPVTPASSQPSLSPVPPTTPSYSSSSSFASASQYRSTQTVAESLSSSEDVGIAEVSISEDEYNAAVAVGKEASEAQLKARQGRGECLWFLSLLETM